MQEVTLVGARRHDKSLIDKGLVVKNVSERITHNDSHFRTELEPFIFDESGAARVFSEGAPLVVVDKISPSGPGVLEFFHYEGIGPYTRIGHGGTDYYIRTDAFIPWFSQDNDVRERRAEIYGDYIDGIFVALENGGIEVSGRTLAAAPEVIAYTGGSRGFTPWNYEDFSAAEQGSGVLVRADAINGNLLPPVIVDESLGRMESTFHDFPPRYDRPGDYRRVSPGIRDA